MTVQWYSGSGSVQSQWVLVAKNSAGYQCRVCAQPRKRTFKYIYLDLSHSIIKKKEVPFGKQRHIRIRRRTVNGRVYSASVNPVLSVTSSGFRCGIVYNILLCFYFINLLFFVAWRLQYCWHFSQWHSVIFTIKCIYIEHFFMFFPPIKKQQHHL